MDRKPGKRVVIVGAGMSGILAAIRFREAGYDVAVFEKADDVGGTWRDNRYPGLSCDVPSHLYSYSFEMNPNWSAMFASGPEIFAYFSAVADKYDVRSLIRFGSEVTACVFEGGRWTITTKNGERDVADIVVFATGILHHPNYPDIRGLETFEGAMFHSSQWRDDVSLEDARVGVVGTGSTAVQIIAAVAGIVKSLDVFQRTPQWVFPRRNRPYTEGEREAFRSDPEQLRRLRDEMSAKFAERFANAVVDADSEQMQLTEKICLENLEEHVEDPALRAALLPSYRAACKRLVMADDFYEAVQAPTVRIVTDSIERAEPKGLRTADGELHELDVLVLATGFNAHQFMRPVHVEGPDGLTLDDLWRDGTIAYRSVGIPSFPNLFTVLGPYSPVGNFSLIEVAEMQVDYILQLLDETERRGAEAVAPSMQATMRELDRIREGSKHTIWVTGCRSWYLDDNGVPATWPFTYEQFCEEMARPDLADFELLPLSELVVN